MIASAIYIKIATFQPRGDLNAIAFKQNLLPWILQNVSRRYFYTLRFYD